MTDNTKEAQNLIISEIEKAFNMLNEHIESNSVASGGMVSATFVRVSTEIIVKLMKEGINKEDQFPDEVDPDKA